MKPKNLAASLVAATIAVAAASSSAQTVEKFYTGKTITIGVG